MLTLRGRWRSVVCVVLLASLTGCTSVPRVKKMACVSTTAAAPEHKTEAPRPLVLPPTIQQINFQQAEQAGATPTGTAEPEELSIPQSLPATVGTSPSGPTASGDTSVWQTYSAADLVQMALVSNPAIAQAEARIRSLRGKWLQVGLPPNPSVGYVGTEIGNENAAGQQGAYLSQDFIRGHKLAWNRAVVAAEITQAQQQLAVVQTRVRTDVRRAFYQALLAERRLELAGELVQLTENAAQASQQLLDADEIPLAGLLQAEVQLQNALVLKRTSENRCRQAWRELTAVIGAGELPRQPLVGDLAQLPGPLDWQQQLERLQTQSPEVAAALSEVTRARRAVCRARVEAVPNIRSSLSVQYDDATQDVVTGVQVGLPLPLWNRNQGGIRQAQAEVTAAVRAADRVELDLARRLATAFRAYADARVTVETYDAEILPRAQRTLELVQQGYQQGEVGYLDSLVAQRTFSQTNLAYLEALSQLWQSHTRIDGLLLEDGLGPPAGSEP